MQKMLTNIPSFEAWIRKNHESSDTYTKRTPDGEETDTPYSLNEELSANACKIYKIYA